jgi:hypothetical protein
VATNAVLGRNNIDASCTKREAKTLAVKAVIVVSKRDGECTPEELKAKYGDPAEDRRLTQLLNEVTDTVISPAYELAGNSIGH